MNRAFLAQNSRKKFWVGSAAQSTDLNPVGSRCGEATPPLQTQTFDLNLHSTLGQRTLSRE